MKGSPGIRIFLLFFLFVYSELEVDAISFNRYGTTKCLKEPEGAVYGGGIIVNPEFEDGIKGWELFGRGKVEERLSKHKDNRNKFIAVLGRSTASDSFSQKVQVKRGKIYAFSAWVQVSEGSDSVAVVFKPNKGDVKQGGSVLAQSGCWSLLKGGIFANFSSTLQISFESKNTSLEIWVDSVSLQLFTKKQWRSEQDESLDKVRKSTVRLQITGADKTPLEGAEVGMKNIRPSFPFGCGMNHYILTLPEYRTWFTARFKVTTFTNEMKWYSTEKTRGEENYTVADAMVDFAQKNGISIRGHNVFWDDPKYQPHWVNDSLTTEDLRVVSEKRLNSVVARYRGKLIAWDVVNENLHFRFFEEKLGPNASAEFYYKAQEIDPKATVFLNEYNTIEYSDDEASSPSNYQKKLAEIMSFSGGKNGLRVGIGVQGHFGSGQPNLAYMRSALDVLGSLGLPLWLTEVDVQYSPHQAEYLEEILREAYSHPSVQGIIMFAGPKAAGFNVTSLADENFKNTPAGDVVDKLIREWHGGTVEAISDGQGFVEMSLFHGDYDVTVKHTNSTGTMSLRVTSDVPQATLQVQIQT